MSNRLQSVQIDDKASVSITTEIGILRGSILGPMIFTLCIVDLHEITPQSKKCSTYANDTTVCTSCLVADLKTQEEEINSIYTELNTWSLVQFFL